VRNILRAIAESGRALQFVFFIVAIIIALSLANCKSISIPEKIIKQEESNEEATQIAKKYIPVGQSQEKVVNALTESSRLLEQSNAETQKAQAAEKKAEADASKWRWVKGIGIALIAAAAGFGVFKILRAV